MSCRQCYQEPIRDAGNVHPIGSYDIDLMIEKGLTLGSPLTAYGGEALLIPMPDLEKIFKASHKKYGTASVQTNGDLITDEHIALFKKYNVSVGVSCEGPGKLNEHRIRRNDKTWKETTRLTLRNLVKLRQAEIPVSVISTLMTSNGSEDRLPHFKKWGLWLASIGIVHVNVHLLETENWLIREKYALKDGRDILAMLDLALWLEKNPQLQWTPFKTIRKLLSMDSANTDCTWHNCDPLTTPAVQAVLGDGSMTNCGRTAKEGIPWVKAEQSGYERYLALYQTPQEYGGCKDCRFFLSCGGQCPGTAINNDWRLRTEDCKLIKALSKFYEYQLMQQGEIPLSLHPARPKMEQSLMALFRNGYRPSSLQSLMETAVFGKQAAVATDRHGDSPHGDSYGHGDEHGDSWG